MARRHKRQRRSKNTNPVTMIALSMALIGGITGLGVFAYQSMGKPIADSFGCYDDVHQAQTFVVADASEPRWNPEQQRSLLRYFKETYQSLSFNERLSVYTTEGDQMGSVLTPRFHVCGSAQSPDDLENIGADRVTAGYLKKDKERRMEKIYLAELNTLFTLTPDSQRRQLYQSPVLEMLQSVSRTSAMNHARKLIVVSDLIQNSDTAQFCRKKGDMPSFHSFSQQRRYRRIEPESFDGIDVEVLMLQRQGYGTSLMPYCRDEDEIMAFYRDYFNHHGARSVSFIRIRDGHTGV